MKRSTTVMHKGGDSTDVGSSSSSDGVGRSTLAKKRCVKRGLSKVPTAMVFQTDRASRRTMNVFGLQSLFLAGIVAISPMLFSYD